MKYLRDVAAFEEALRRRYEDHIAGADMLAVLEVWTGRNDIEPCEIWAFISLLEVRGFQIVPKGAAS